MALTGLFPYVAFMTVDLGAAANVDKAGTVDAIQHFLSIINSAPSTSLSLYRRLRVRLHRVGIHVRKAVDELLLGPWYVCPRCHGTMLIL